MTKTVFITYSWDTPEHKNWVRSIADNLISSGVQVLLDQYDIQPGESFTHFMESAISKADKVVVVLTPQYKDKSIERKGGVGYEQQIISGEIMSGIDRKKFIPLMRYGKYEAGEDCAVPPHFMGISTIDFRDPSKEAESLEQLLRVIYDEPKYVKPLLGNKPNFEKEVINSSFVIQLDQDFNCLQSDNLLTDLFLRISDLRKSGSAYKLDFAIRGISDEYFEYLQLAELQIPTELEINRKLELRHYLNECFYLPNGTIYEYLTLSINSIVDYSFNKYKYLTNYQELLTSIKQCLKLFSRKNDWKQGTTKFDVFHNQIKFGFSIWISNNEVEELLSKFSVKDKMFLTAIAGLDTYDLSHSTLIEQVIPKESYQFTIDYFQKRILDELKEEYFRIGNWRIGLG